MYYITLYSLYYMVLIMKQKEIELLYEYCLSIRLQYENEVTQQLNNIRFARSDSIDILALASAKHDHELVVHLTNQIIELMKLKRGNEI